MSPRALDHVVMPCADLGAAAAAFKAMGFLVGRRNRHPWGTENHIIQWPGVFLELIALAADAVPVSRDDDAFPFVAFLAGQGASRDPSGMLVLRSEDAAADAEAFAAAGIGAGRRLDFARSGTAPDGSIRTVAFSLAFAEAPMLPDLGFFVCQQHDPEHFWNPAQQRHPNGTTGIAAVAFTAPRPAELAPFLERFAATTPMTAAGGVLHVPLAEATVLTVAPGDRSARMAGLVFRTSGAPGIDRFGAYELTFAS